MLHFLPNKFYLTEINSNFVTRIMKKDRQASLTIIIKLPPRNTKEQWKNRT